MGNSKGFTLLELMIVVVIIGILASIAIPKFGATKQRAYITAVKSDLRNLVTAEESYYADNVTYSNTLATSSFNTSAGVTVVISGASGTGWSATGVHSGAPSHTCSIYMGDAVIAGQSPGNPVCQ